jgi:hypothetical protein
MSDQAPRRKPPAEDAALMVVDLLDAIGQCDCSSGRPLEDPVLARLQQVSDCEALPEAVRALAGRLVADHLSRAPATHGRTMGQWLIH